MYRPALRLASARALPHQQSLATSRRFLTTAPPHKLSRSWKNSALRWSLAGGIIYYYMTSNVFADEPQYATHAPPETQREAETYATIDAVAEQRRAQARSQSSSTNTAAASTSTDSASPEGLEQEAEQQGAFNEETGEINWDCPCLGGMAHGPCGEQFRTAFSCFVFSKEDPKGVDCIEHFKGMQDCFREHPEIYGAELDDTEAEMEGEMQGDGVGGEALARDASGHIGEKVAEGVNQRVPHAEAGKTERALQATEQVKSQHGSVEGLSESESAVPKAWHDGTAANTEK